MNTKATNDSETHREPLSHTALNKANIDNLAAMWRAMGAEPAGTVAPGLQASPGWPNRFWFDWGEPLPPSPALSEALDQLPGRAMVPVWRADIRPGPLEQALRDLGFGVVLEQRAMHLRLDKWQPSAPTSLKLRQVMSQSELHLWATLCGGAFGYAVDNEVIVRLARDERASLWLAEREGQAVATAALFRTGDIAGLHQVGVPEVYRGRGIARELMQALMLYCGEEAITWLTLQASAEGEGLYRQLGFERRFRVDTYQRK